MSHLSQSDRLKHAKMYTGLQAVKCRLIWYALQGAPLENLPPSSMHQRDKPRAFLLQIRPINRNTTRSQAIWKVLEPQTQEYLMMNSFPIIIIWYFLGYMQCLSEVFDISSLRTLWANTHINQQHSPLCHCCSFSSILKSTKPWSSVSVEKKKGRESNSSWKWSIRKQKTRDDKVKEEKIRKN